MKTFIAIILIVLAGALMCYSIVKNECERQNGFLWRTAAGVKCIPYRNDMQKYGSYPQP